MLNGFSIIQWALLSLGLTFPGWGIAARFSRLNKDALAVEVLICSVIASLLCTVLFAGALFAAGVWNPIIFQLGLFGLSCVSFLFFRGTDFFRALLRKPVSLLLVPISLILSSLSWGPPSEWISYNNYDAGRYSNIAGFMLQSGGIKVDRVFNELGLLEPSDYSFPKYYFDDPQKVEFELPYLHLFPASMAIVRSSFGLENSLRINQFLSFTGLLAFFALLKRYGLSAGWCGAGIALLGSNPAFVFYAKRTMGEMLALNLVIGFFYFLSICDEYKSKLFSIFAAFSVFALATCRLEYGSIYGLIVILPVLTRVAFSQSLGIGLRNFVIVATFLLLPLGWYYIKYCNFYIYRNVVTRLDDLAQILNLAWRPDLNFPAAKVLVLVNLLIVACGLGIARFFGNHTLPFNEAQGSSKMFRHFFPLVVVCLLLYAWLVRPLIVLDNVNPAIVWAQERQLNFPKLLYFIDPLSVLSIALLTIHSVRNRNASLILVATLFSLLVGVINNYHSDLTLGWIRRFIPLVIPGCYISLILFLSSKKRLGQLVLIPIIGLNLCSTLNSMFAVRENPGAINTYQQIKDSLGNEPTIISFDGKMASSLTVPLHSQFNVPALYLSRGVNYKKIRTIQRLLSARKNVYVVHTGGGSESEFERLQKDFGCYGLTLEKHLTRSLSLKAYDHFCTEWRPGQNFSYLFLPPALNGLCARFITYPVNIWKVSTLPISRVEISKLGSV